MLAPVPEKSKIHQTQALYNTRSPIQCTLIYFVETQLHPSLLKFTQQSITRKSLRK